MCTSPRDSETLNASILRPHETALESERSITLVVRQRGVGIENDYHRGGERIAHELFRSGRLVLRDGVIPDGIVIEHYHHGARKRVFTYRMNSLTGVRLRTIPQANCGRNSFLGRGSYAESPGHTEETVYYGSSAHIHTGDSTVLSSNSTRTASQKYGVVTTEGDSVVSMNAWTGPVGSWKKGFTGTD